LLDVTGPLQVFASANDLVVEAGGTPPYAPRVVAQRGKSVTASAGLGIAVAPLPPANAAVDTLMIAGGQGVEAAAADPVLVDWVRERAQRHGASPPSAPGRSSWPPQACWMGDARQPIGHSAPSLPGAIPPCASSPIRSLCATARFGPLQG